MSVRSRLANSAIALGTAACLVCACRPSGAAEPAAAAADTPTAGLQLDFRSEVLGASYAGVDVIVAAQFYFADSGWQTIFNIPAPRIRQSREGQVSRGVVKGAGKGVASYELRLQWTKDKLEIEFEYDVVPDGPARFAVCDLFLSKPLFLKAKHTGPKGDTAGEFNAFGAVSKIAFATSVGKLDWEFTTERQDPGQPSPWVLRDTRPQRWRPEPMRTFSFLNSFTREPGAPLKQELHATLTVTPRPYLAHALEAAGLSRTFAQLEQRSPALRARIQDDAEIRELRQRLQAIAETPDPDPTVLAQTLAAARALIETLGREYGRGAFRARPSGPVVIPQPQQMERLPGAFQIDGRTVIVVPAEAGPEERRGPDILRQELRDYFGIDVPIVADNAAPAGKRPIMIAATGRSEPIDRACRELGLNVTPADPGPEGAALRVASNRIVAVGSDVRGAFYAVQTLLQLVQRDQAGEVTVPGVNIRDWPAMKLRGMMIIPGRGDLDYFRRAIRRVIARHKFNLIVIGEASMGNIRWKSHPEIAGEHSWDPDALQECVEYARQHFLDVVPLVQCWGHAKAVVRALPELAETPDGNALCLSNPKTRQFLTDIYAEALDIFKPRIFHLGGDEAAPIGACETCREKPAHELVASHLTFLHDWLAERGVKTMMWHDMLLEHDKWKDSAPSNSGKKAGLYGGVTHPAVEKLPRDLIMAVWIYRNQEEFPALQHFQDLGFPVVACPWYDEGNNYWYALRAQEAGAMGLLGTSWMFTSWHNLNMMSLLAAEYAWTPGTPKLEELPYLAREKMQRAMTPALPSFTAARMTPVDIRQWCNRSLRDDAGGDGKGWLDQGPLYDMRLLPEGRLELEGVPFEIPPFAATEGRQCIAVAGKDRPDLGLPVEVKEIRVGRKVRSLAFLHTGSFTHARAFAQYVVRYGDGTEAVVPINERGNIMPSRKPKRFDRTWKRAMYSGYLADARRAWVGLNLAGEEIDLQALEWVNPAPEKEVATVTFRMLCHHRQAVALLLAITAVE